MPIHQENPTYFSDKPTSSASSLNRGTSLQSIQQQQNQNQPRCGISTFGARRKHSSVTSCEDTEDGSEMETFLSSCESNNSYNGSSSSGIPGPVSNILARNQSHKSFHSNSNNGYTHGSLKRSTSTKNYPNGISPGNQQNPNEHSKISGINSLTRLGKLFKKSKSKLSVASDSHASTIESSGIGSPTCTPDSSLSIYTNSLDGDSHSSSNSNQISPKHLGESMEDRFCSTYTFDDCGIFAANMYYNVGESSVFTIYHQHNNTNANSGDTNDKAKPLASSSRGRAISNRDDEFEDCVQPYYNNTTFSTFPNPKRCSVASAASTTTSSVVPVPIPFVNNNENKAGSLTSVSGKATELQTHPIQHDRDGYLKPNEARNLRNVKNLYINDSVIATANRNGQVQQVQVDVHTPTSSSLISAGNNQDGNFSPFSETNNYSREGGSGGFNSSGAGSSANSGSGGRYHFDSTDSATSAATTIVAGGSNNFLSGLPEGDEIKSSSRVSSRNGPLPVYMNRAYFGSNSILPTNKTNHSSASSSSSSSARHISQHHQKISPGSVAADCEPYCSLCASSIMGSPRQRSKMDVVIVKCKECFFSRQAESHIRGFFDKLMTEDKQKMDVILKSYDLKDLDHPTDRVVVHSAKVQIVIISPHFLQRLKDEASRRPRLSPINRVFRSKNVIAVLLAVTAPEVLDGYESVLPRFREWFSVDLRSTNKYDQEFCKKFTEQVVRIYKVELSNSSNFSVYPKKVTKEQPKIVVVFKKPIEQNDAVRIELRTGKQEHVISQVKLENPHTTLLRIPETLSPDREAIVDVSVFINNIKIGGSRIKSELNSKRFDEDEIDRMAKLLPPFVGWIDKHIAETLMKHYRECTDYSADPELDLMNGVIICKGDILPTVMHFAAYYGLRQTAYTVLEEADGLPQCSTKNDLNETPIDIAFARGHTELGQLIKNYYDISHSYIAHKYLMEIVDKEIENRSNFVGDTTLQQLNNEFPPKQVDALNKNDDNDETKAYSPSISEVGETSQGPHSEVEPIIKNDEEVAEERKIPTPKVRRAKTGRANNTPTYYVNMRNPDENPEIVIPREKKPMTSPVDKKRFSIIENNYDIPRSKYQDYEVPPPDARPVLKTELDGEKASTDPIFKPKKPVQINSGGYIIIEPGPTENPTDEVVEPAEQTETSIMPKPTEILSSSNSSSTEVGTTAQMHTSTKNETSSSKNDLHELVNSRPGPTKNDVVVLDAADEQLIELMNDFKNKTYDIKQVELIFESWKQRTDVQASMKKKMEMLDQLREEYREIQQLHNSKKKSVIDKIKTSLTLKRKKSNAKTLPNSSPDIQKDTEISTNNIDPFSSTALTFTGPRLPSPVSQHKTTISPSISQHSIDFRVSESSHRTSIDSRISDGSTDSDKTTSETSTNSSKTFAPATLEYHSPLSKRFIPSYVTPGPNQFPKTTVELDSNGVSSSLATTTCDADDSYKVPPPPRPVRPKKNPVEDNKTSPNISRKPPPIPNEAEEALLDIPRTPPALPKKPTPKYLGTDATSPPPVPPPRTNNSPTMFNYIDYKKKNQDGSAKVKKSYENMDKPSQVIE